MANLEELTSYRIYLTWWCQGQRLRQLLASRNSATGGHSKANMLRFTEIMWKTKPYRSVAVARNQ